MPGSPCIHVPTALASVAVEIMQFSTEFAFPTVPLLCMTPGLFLNTLHLFCSRLSGLESAQACCLAPP